MLAHLAFGSTPWTRQERAAAFGRGHAAWLATLPGPAAKVLRTLADQFARGGVEALESKELFNTPSVQAAGGLDALKLAGRPADLVRELKERMLAA